MPEVWGCFPRGQVHNSAAGVDSSIGLRVPAGPRRNRVCSLPSGECCVVLICSAHQRLFVLALTLVAVNVALRSHVGHAYRCRPLFYLFCLSLLYSYCCGRCLCADNTGNLLRGWR